MEEQMKRVYLIDSENVGDLWVTHILALAKEQDEIVVFYTQKSPHMGYDTVRKLLANDREVDFVKCTEGRNALDFQLVTELGFRLGRQTQEQEYIMVTNDTGFDAVVTYWQNAGKAVKRYNAKYCQNQYNKMMVEAQLHTERKEEQSHPESEQKSQTVQREENETTGAKTSRQMSDPVDRKPAETVENKSGEPLEENVMPEEKNEEQTETVGQNQSKDNQPVRVQETEEDKASHEDKEKELLTELVSCLGANNSGEIHNALIMLLGNDGKQVYQQVRGNLKEYSVGENMEMKDKFQHYCHLVFEHSEIPEAYPKNFSNFVYGAKDKRKNLNSFRSALQKEYGKEKGLQYYSIIKPHVKILNKIQK